MITMFNVNIELSCWMPKLFRPMEHAHREQIKIRAAAQNREMTKKSVKKGTQKKTSVLWQNSETNPTKKRTP